MRRRTIRRRRGFNLVELLIALTITSTLLAATLVALDASFMAYQATTEQASTHSIARMIVQRVLTLVRTSVDFGPFPTNPLDTTVESNFVEFERPDGDIYVMEWIPDQELLTIEVNGTTYPLLDGVIEQLDGDDNVIAPFTLEYENGRKLYRATVNMMIAPDDNLSLDIEGDNAETIHLVASAMPRNAALED